MLLAAYPRLSTAEIKEVIIKGADIKNISGGRTIRLLNEVRSFEGVLRPMISGKK
jgi:hypothetical protein